MNDQPNNERVSHLTVDEIIAAFTPWERMQKAGYISVHEFFDKHGWSLNVEQIREILEREAGTQSSKHSPSEHNDRPVSTQARNNP